MIHERTACILSLLIILLSIPSLAQLREEWHNEGDRGDLEWSFYGARAYPFNRIPQNARLDALLESRWKMKPFREAHGVQSANVWKPIGPFDLGGRITSIALHPTDGRTLWIGAAAGGVWKSTDRGESWNPVMDFENAITMGAVAVDPSNPAIIYAGTGEAAENIDSYGGAGIMKSTDGGATWRSSGLANVAAFSSIAVHPRDGRIVFAAGIKNNAGLYRSSDGGGSWSRIVPVWVSDITINPANPDELWIGASLAGVMHSTDAGLTFAPSGDGLAFDGTGMGRVSVKVAPSAPNILYTLIHESRFPDGNLSRIYKSTNSGASWENILDNDPNLLNYYGHVQGQYNNVLAVKPDDPNVVIAGGVVLLRSTNGGTSWDIFESQLHPDHHALAFDPADPTRLYAGNDGGMYRSDDAGGSYRRITSGLAITQFYGLAVDQRKPNLTYGGTQDNGTITTEARDYWGGGPGVVGGGDGFQIVLDPVDTNILYYEQPYGQIMRKNLATGASDLFITGLPFNDPNDRAAWSAPLLADPANPGGLLCGRRRVYSRNPPFSWAPISPRFKTPISAMAISTVDPNVIYAGSGLANESTILLSDGVPLGELKVTTDGGESWSDRTVGAGLPNRIITEIVASSVDSCTAYVAYSGFYTGHIFKTTDCGRSWRDIGGGLPDIPVNALALHPDDERIIYAGTDIGVFITSDGGASWSTYNDGLPRSIVADLAIHHGSRTLRLATHGRSMWEIPLETSAPAPSITAPAGGETWMGRSQRTLAWGGLAGSVRVEYSIDDGSSWRTIAENVQGNSFRWTLPDSAAVAARVRVTEMADPGKSVVSRSFSVERFKVGGVLTSTLKAYPCWGVAYDGEHLWASVENSDSLLKLDRNTLATLEIVRIGSGEKKRRFSDITYHPGRGTFFLHEVANASPDEKGNTSLYEVSKSGAILHTWTSPCYYPTGLAWIGDSVDGYLLAADLFGGQELYQIDPEDGEVIRTIPRPAIIELGPAGIAATGDGKTFWQVIGSFDFDRGPQGSAVSRFSVENLAKGCSIPLEATRDTAIAGGYASWGKLFARGVERDPEDGNLWITNLDGAIYKFTVCDATAAGVDPAPQDAAPQDAAPSAAAPLATLEAISPNPFSGPLELRFTLEREAHVRLDLFDAQGRSAGTLADARFQAGRHALPFDPSSLSSGIYHCTLSIEGSRSSSRMMIYIK